MEVFGFVVLCSTFLIPMSYPPCCVLFSSSHLSPPKQGNEVTAWRKCAFVLKCSFCIEISSMPTPSGNFPPAFFYYIQAIHITCLPITGFYHLLLQLTILKINTELNTCFPHIGPSNGLISFQ